MNLRLGSEIRLTLMSFSDLASSKVRARHLHMSLSNKLEPPWIHGNPFSNPPPAYLLIAHPAQPARPQNFSCSILCLRFTRPSVFLGHKTLHSWMLGSGLGVTNVQSLSFALIVPKLNIWIA